MKVKCPHCETIQNAPDDADGKKAMCKECRGTFVLTPHSIDPNTTLDNSTPPIETNWTAIWMKVICVVAVAWVLGFACGAILTRPGRQRVKSEIARHTQIADQERRAHDAEEEKVSRFKALNAELRERGEDQLAYIRKLENRLKALSEKIASAESAKPPKETVTQKEQEEKVQTKPISPRRNASRYVQQVKWYEGGTLHRAKMKEWSQASYKNKLATAADFVMGGLQTDGVDLMTVDIEGKIKPMAIDFAKGLDNANEGGIADNLAVAEVAATMWVMMKGGN